MQFLMPLSEREKRDAEPLLSLSPARGTMPTDIVVST